MNKIGLSLIQVLRTASLWAMPIAVCVLALMPMWPVTRNFSSDWYNHLWLTEYAGYHLWLTGSPPEVLSTPQAVGMPVLLFYAQKFYTVLGAVSFTVGSALTVRLAAFTLVLVQFYHVQRAARAAGAPASVCAALPVLVTWQVFQASTLYERGDVTEYCAIILLTICVANLYVLALRTAQRSRDPYGFWTTGLYYGLAAVTHPLTAVYGGAFVAFTGLSVLVVVRSKQILRFAAFNFLALSLLLAPWLLVVLRYARKAGIANSGINAADFVGLFTNSPLATLLEAFSPTSFYAYSTKVSFQQDSAEVNVQLSLPLLVLVMVLFVACRRFSLRGGAAVPVLRTLLAVAYGIFWISFLVYCSPGASFLFGHAFDILQFAYRLGAYVNLALLLGTLASLGLINWDQVQSAKLGSLLCQAGALALVILSGIGWFSKCIFLEVNHSYTEGTSGLDTLLRQRGWETRSSGYWVPGLSDQDDVCLTDLPATGYFQSAYDIRTGLRKGRELTAGTRAQSIPFGLGRPFTTVMPKEMDLKERTLVLTNVNPFPWNQLVLDGRPVPGRELFALPSLYGFQLARLIRPSAYALFVDRGQHTLAYRFSPDPPWRWLNVLSWLTLAGWVVGAAGVAGFLLRHRTQPQVSASTAKLTMA